MSCNSQDYRQRAQLCATRAAICNSPAASQKFADLAIVWLMLAVQLEEEFSDEGAQQSNSSARAQ